MPPRNNQVIYIDDERGINQRKNSDAPALLKSPAAKRHDLDILCFDTQLVSNDAPIGSVKTKGPHKAPHAYCV